MASSERTLHRPTLESLQSIAEHLLAADLHRHTGKVGLRRTLGGFGQPEFFVNGKRRRLRVDGTRLALLEGDHERWTELTTLADLARFAATGLGAPGGVFEATTTLEPEAGLNIDARTTGRLTEFYRTAEAALEELRSANTGRRPALVQLWPEHFDLATNLEEVNFGASPGDEAVPEPYFYVGPWEPREGDFWNEPFGAVLRHGDVSQPDDVLDFFSVGLRLATT